MRTNETRIERYEVQAFSWGYAGFHATYVNGKCEHCYQVTGVAYNERLAKVKLDAHLAKFATRH